MSHEKKNCERNFLGDFQFQSSPSGEFFRGEDVDQTGIEEAVVWGVDK